MITLSPLERDALAEIFNIGVGIAADLLSQMVGESVQLSVPQVELLSEPSANTYYLARIPRPLCAIRQTYKGEVTTEAVLMFPEKNSLELVRLMVPGNLPQEQLNDMEQDAMAEVGNIILNAVVSSLASSLGLRFEGSLPTVNSVADEHIFSPHEATDQATILALIIDFTLKARQVSGHLAFFLDVSSSEKLGRSLSEYIQKITA